MPRIHSENGFDIYIFTDDHDPAHVHIYRAECFIKVNLLDLSLI